MSYTFTTIKKKSGKMEESVQERKEAANATKTVSSYSAFRMNAKQT